ncbi:ABC transporter substrate-binding protein [Alicyclobacillus fodiniaquatilis]|uniref:ABC transporter substrate-binding protein n=1 Tax=Alicyclobacillus fodiniaquatilis TaxID=1661150 RepID=A0ABW4JQT9_9BACL
MRKRFLAACSVLGLSVGLAGCGAAQNVDLTKISSSSPPAQPKYDTTDSFTFDGSWPMPPQFQGNPFAAGGEGTGTQYEFEQLFEYIRSTQQFTPRLAASYKNTATETIVHLRKNARWSDGAPITSKDIWAYYMLQHTEVTNYLTNIETPDAHTVVFVWAKQTNPFNQMRMALISQDNQGEIPYHIYGKYADKEYQLLQEAKKQSPTWTANTWMGVKIPTAIQTQMTKNYANFTSDTPPDPICSGPYMVYSTNNTDQILVKNPYYWDRKDVKFKELWIKQIQQVPAQWAELKSGQLDYYDGTPPQDVLNAGLASNPDLVHYQMEDVASIGMYFNLREPIFQNEKFRQALAYVFDRSKIRDVGNYFGVTSPYNMTGLVPSTLSSVLSKQTLSKMTKYTYNPAKATQMLEQLGWKKENGKWHEPNGKVPHFIIGANTTWMPGVLSGQVAAQQLTDFGIPTSLIAADASIEPTNADNGKYDMSIDWVDVTFGYSSPWNSLDYMFWSTPEQEIGFPTYKSGPNNGHPKTNLIGLNGQKVDPNTYINEFPVTHNAAKRQEMTDNMAYAINQAVYGINFFQNVTGAWANVKMLGGNWPMENEWSKYDRNMPLPKTGTETALKIAEMNTGFGSDWWVFNYWPN